MHPKLQVNGQTFEGEGKTKKKAKLVAAEKALTSFVQFPNAAEVHQTLGQHITSGDFTSDTSNDDNNLEYENTNISCDWIISKQAVRYKYVNRCACRISEQKYNTSCNNQLHYYDTKLLDKSPQNPVMLLNEFRPGVKYELISESGESHSKNFIMSVMVDGQSFYGSGYTKKLAMVEAAQSAINNIFYVSA